MKIHDVEHGIGVLTHAAEKARTYGLYPKISLGTSGSTSCFNAKGFLILNLENYIYPNETLAKEGGMKKTERSSLSTRTGQLLILAQERFDGENRMPAIGLGLAGANNQMT